MMELEHVERIAAPADRVWDCVRWEALEELDTGLFERVAYAQREPIVGARRRIALRDGGTIEERLEAVDEEGRWFAYRMLDTGPVPIADYSGEVRVSACGPDAAFVRFSCRCTPVGLTPTEWSALYRDMQIEFCAAIRDALAAPRADNRPRPAGRI
jgi:hypothetical protein